MIPLQYQVSSQFFVLGPFISTDGDTESTGLTINNTDVILFKKDSTSAVTKSTTGLTAIQDGYYGGKFSSDDTDTYGVMQAYVHVSSALYCKEYFEILPDNEYNARTSTTYKNVITDSMSSGAISSQIMSSGAISTITISTTMSDVIAHSIWAESTKVLTAFSTALWSTAFHSTAFWSTAFYSTSISDNISTAVWDYGTKALTDKADFTLANNAISSAKISSGAFYSSAHILSSLAFSSGFISSNSFSSGAISTETISTAAWDVGAHSNWAESTKILTALSTGLWSTAFWSTGISDNISTAVWSNSTRELTGISTVELSTEVLNSISTAVWDYGTRALTDLSSFALSTTAYDAIFNVLVESTMTVKHALILLSAHAFGPSTGGGTSTAVFYGVISTVARITATTSSLGNRSTLTFNVS